MDVKRIEAAVAAYRDGASPVDVARLDFFDGVWRIQKQQMDALSQSNFEVPSPEQVNEWYWSGIPLLSKAPVAIDVDVFTASCKEISAHMAAEAGLDAQAVEALNGFDWDAFCADADLALVGSDPAQFVDNCLVALDELGVPSSLPASVFAMVLIFALRVQLDGPAAQLMKQVDLKVERSEHDQPLDCPVCASRAVLSMVERGVGGNGRGRRQYCTLCGTAWPFERIRCGNCGLVNEGKLHYFHVEGDPAHRLQNCDACGGYQRMVFQEDLKAPLSPDVEDVVMARLDHIAHDPRFKA